MAVCRSLVAAALPGPAQVRASAIFGADPGSGAGVGGLNRGNREESDAAFVKVPLLVLRKFGERGV